MSSLENFKIVQMVAKGGTAVLYKAIQTSLDRTVAIKKLHQHLTDDENFTRRFILEAKAAASLDHENIVRVIDFGKADSDYQIVMEFVEGRSLKELLQEKKKLPYDIALSIIHQICHGLEHAHAKGIIHRDLKPGNILITNYGRVKITDFGLAKLTQGSSQQTAPDSLLGTPLYMSPEQAYGESVDARSDIFSLGTMLYEMLTGRQPFFSSNCAGVINNIISCKVPPPSSLSEDIPDNVEHIVLKALCKHREARYQRAAELRKAIEDCLGIVALKKAEEKLPGLLSDNTETVLLTNKHSPAAKRARRNRKAFITGLVAAIGILAAVTVLYFDTLSRSFKSFSEGRSSTTSADNYIEKSSFSQSGGFQDLGGIYAGSNSTGAQVSTIKDTLQRTPDNQLAHGGLPAQTDSVALDDAELNEDSTAATDARTQEAERPDIKPSQEQEQAAVKEQSQPEKEKRAREGWLTVSADPWAEIYIDGRYRADTPPAPSISLPAGAHTLECRNPQYETYKEDLSIISGELSRREIKLIKLRGKIEIDTQAGAEFYLDGRLAGLTPLPAPVEVDIGRHTLVIKKSGFNTWHSEINIEANQAMTLKITLSPHF